MPTIFAQSSGTGKAGISVYRISGSLALQTAKILTNRKTFEPRQTYFTEIFNPDSKELIDKGLVIYFKAPASFTGEDVVELHLHGSLAISKIILNVLSKIKGLRMAEPGEFSKRAFLRGQFDLTQAEGLVDLINSETEMQHKQALLLLNGQLGNLYESWRLKLLKVMSYIEAFIDFPDEEIPSQIILDINNTVINLTKDMQKHLEDNNKGEKIRTGINLCIFGPPNVGKSSLINYLANNKVAITSPIPGTTRDSIETFINIGGYPVCIIDTAGIRTNTSDEIELEGIKIAVNNAQKAHIKLLMLDINSDINHLDPSIKKLLDHNTIKVINKIDLDKNIKHRNLENNAIYISLHDNLNLDSLNSQILARIKEEAGSEINPRITRLRHRFKVEAALELLSGFSIDKDLVLAAEDLRMATRTLSFLTGKITVDEILGEIFSSFCIGK